ncbi:MAG: hypothetical protein KME31_15100 [Tolypothrix carrinoi HA7290-LM1]|jgi:hypothetical protein|nr:hypothetical protein [Tolypothrix carrinoi HA7290-LM1]
MVCACFVKVAYYCWLTTRFAVLICLNFIGCSDLASAKRHLDSSAYLAKFSAKILLDEQNQNTTSCDYKSLMPYISGETNYPWILTHQMIQTVSNPPRLAKQRGETRC